MVNEYVLLQKLNLLLFTSFFDISQTNKARKLRLRSKEASWNSLSRPHIVFKFSMRGSRKNLRLKMRLFFVSNLMWVLLWPIDEKVEFGQKRLIVASPDQFSWIPHVLAHQNCYCPNCFKNFYYFYYFKNRAPFFLAQVVSISNTLKFISKPGILTSLTCYTSSSFAFQ